MEFKSFEVLWASILLYFMEVTVSRE
ncbi:unnamed protein product, partial [Allacma fusca]